MYRIFHAWTGGDHPFLASRDKPMLLSTVYRCVDLISDSVAVLLGAVQEWMRSAHLSRPSAYELLNLSLADMTRLLSLKRWWPPSY